MRFYDRGRIDTVKPGHVYIHQYNIGRGLLQIFQYVAAVGIYPGDSKALFCRDEVVKAIAQGFVIVKYSNPDVQFLFIYSDVKIARLSPLAIV